MDVISVIDWLKNSTNRLSTILTFGVVVQIFSQLLLSSKSNLNNSGFSGSTVVVVT